MGYTGFDCDFMKIKQVNMQITGNISYITDYTGISA